MKALPLDCGALVALVSTMFVNDSSEIGIVPVNSHPHVLITPHTLFSIVQPLHQLRTPCCKHSLYRSQFSQ